MKYLRQFIIIIGISFLGEFLNHIIPLPVPGSIYGLVIMLVLLCTGLLKVSAVKETSSFLLETMPVMFVPAAAGIIKYWSIIKPIFIPFVIILIVVTAIVMAVTGRVTQFIIRKGGSYDK